MGWETSETVVKKSVSTEEPNIDLVRKALDLYEVIILYLDTDQIATRCMNLYIRCYMAVSLLIMIGFSEVKKD